MARALAAACVARGLAHHVIPRAALDIADEVAARALFRALRPWLVINAAGYVRVDDAERDRERCRRENVLGVACLKRAAAEVRAPLVTFSSDLVFDGSARPPYTEDAAPAPLNEYGRSKADAEIAAGEGALVIRTAAFFAPGERGDFVTAALAAFAEGRTFVAASDVIVSPTSVHDLAHASLDLACDRARGVFHLANAGQITWAELARRAAARANVPARTLVERPLAEMGWLAPRPLFSALGTARGLALPPLDEVLARAFV